MPESHELAAIERIIAQLTDALGRCMAELAERTGAHGQDAEAAVLSALERARASAGDAAGNVAVARTIERLAAPAR